MKKTLFFAVLSLFSAQARAVRPPAATVESDTIWMRLFDKDKPGDYYIEVAKDGNCLARAETKAAVVTRRGKVNERLIRDLFQEVENSDAFDYYLETEKGHTIFFKGEMIELSAFWHGELRNVVMPVKELGAGFSYALAQIRKNAEKIPKWEGLEKLLKVTPISAVDLEEMQKGRIGADFTRVETADVDRIKPLATGILRPFRLIPMDNPEFLKKLDDFIEQNNLKGFRDTFFFATSRGNFKCVLLEAQKAPVK